MFQYFTIDGNTSPRGGRVEREHWSYYATYPDEYKNFKDVVTRLHAAVAKNTRPIVFSSTEEDSEEFNFWDVYGSFHDKLFDTLGFKRVPDPNRGGYFNANNDKVKKQTQAIMGDYPADTTAGTNIFFARCEIMEHQYRAGVETPVLRRIDTKTPNKRYAKNHVFTETWIVFRIAVEKPSFGHNAENIYWISCGVWGLSPIYWNRWCCDHIKVSQVLKMQYYYSRQAFMPDFSCHKRQSGSGLGFLAAGVGRVALPFPKKYLYQL